MSNADEVLGRFGLAAPTPGLAPRSASRFDVPLLLGLALYDLGLSFLVAAPFREALRAIVRTHPQGEAALLSDGAFRLVHAALVTQSGAAPVIASFVVFLALALLLAPFVSAVVIGRFAYDDRPGVRAGAGSLFRLAARHYHRVAGLLLAQILVQGLVAGIFWQIGNALSDSGGNDRARTLILVAGILTGFVLGAVVTWAFDILRVIALSEEVPLGRALEMARALVKRSWKPLFFGWAIRALLSLALSLPIFLVIGRAPNGTSLFLMGQGLLILRTALYLSWIQLAARVVRAAPSDR